MDKLTKLIVNADDFGFTDSVSRGIIEAYKDGIVTSTTLMASLPTAKNAAMLALENPGLAVGIHFVLTSGYPVSAGVSSLVNLDGRFPKHEEFETKTGINADEVEKEFRAQLERFLSFGLTPSHFDSHHHVHLTDTVRPVVEKLAKEHNVPVRCYGDVHFIDGFFDETANMEVLCELLNASKSHDVAEFMCHPGYVDDTLRSIDSYRDMREKELAVLTSPELKQLIEKLNIELISYKDI